MTRARRWANSSFGIASVNSAGWAAAMVTVASQTSQALEAMTLVVVLYAVINLLIALAVGLANRRLLAREGR